VQHLCTSPRRSVYPRRPLRCDLRALPAPPSPSESPSLVGPSTGSTPPDFPWFNLEKRAGWRSGGLDLSLHLARNLGRGSPLRFHAAFCGLAMKKAAEGTWNRDRSVAGRSGGGFVFVRCWCSPGRPGKEAAFARAAPVAPEEGDRGDQGS